MAESFEAKLAAAKKSYKRAKWEKGAWIVFIVPYMYFFRDSVAVVGLLSIYALVVSVRSVEMAAKAEIAGYENPSPEGSTEDPEA